EQLLAHHPGALGPGNGLAHVEQQGAPGAVAGQAPLLGPVVDRVVGDAEVVGYLLGVHQLTPLVDVALPVVQHRLSCFCRRLLAHTSTAFPVVTSTTSYVTMADVRRAQRTRSVASARVRLSWGHTMLSGSPVHPAHV